MNCVRPGCGGTILDGYCDTCGLAPATGAAAAAPASGGTASGGTPAAGAMASSRTSTRASASVKRGSDRAQGSRRTVRLDSSRTAAARLGAGLVQVAPIQGADPRNAVMDPPEVAEEKRYCWSCGQPVGRSKAGREGRTKGFCSNCGSAFDLDPRLTPGTLVGGQYEVVGCLAHGGMGWIYLGVDRNVSDRPVVLKGVLNQGDTEAVAAAIAEKQFLAEIKHGNIVEIYNFVEHDGAGYIVMEYVGGKSLKSILKDRMKDNSGVANPLPIDQAIAYMLGILPAFSFLHTRGYLYCDFKPDNVMHEGEDLTLIDLGGVRRIDDQASAIYGTAGFQAPEVPELGCSISSDLYTVVRTLAVLTLDFPGYQTTNKHTLPDPASTPVFGQHESFYRLLVKGTADNPDDRFQSVEELAEQLVGVLREVVAVQTGTARPAVSSRFTGDRFDPATVAEANWLDLPDLKPNPSDAAASLLNELATIGPDETLRRLNEEVTQGRVETTPEIRLRVVRAYIEAGSRDQAVQELNAVERADPWEWRASWYWALIALQENEPATAVTELDRVRTDVPGELAPKLAAAFAAEQAGDHAEAAALYTLVSTVDVGYVSALFGLARCQVALGDPDAAVASLDRVPATSAARTSAQIERANLLTRRAKSSGSLADAEAAVGSIEQLRLDPVQRVNLSIDTLQQLLDGLRAGTVKADPGRQLFGQPATEVGVRTALERNYRELARAATTVDERIRLVDLANSVRPVTLV
jgi:serine/threonine-protein kinase PknG